MNIGQLKDREIVNEMEESYLDYAMSVIVARALPDVRDGLKPVHRRILYAMHQLGLRHNVKYRKSALVVGDVLGKYHPHGDIAVYDTLVRMAQDFSFRYPLVDGQGNFGSMDGDNPAAMRYTECRMTAAAEEMLADIEKETVDFVDNYDASRKEPRILPARLPQMLLNGTMGIAVGMATNIPPHNLGELVDALVLMLEKPEAGIEDIINFVKGPDFPTGGTIYNKNDILQAYATGKGRILTRAQAEIQETKKGHRIVVSEIVYQTNKAQTIAKIAELARLNKLDGIKDIRDESDKEGVRIVIELKKDAQPNKILNKLYLLTDLQKAFNVNMLALVDNGIQPKVLGLKEVMEHFLEHRKIVVRRRTEFDLKKARERMHILEGLKKALDHIDEVIALIKKSSTKENAHRNLIKKFGFSELQATAILEMKLQTLAGLERRKIDDELKEKQQLIANLEAILASEKLLKNVIKQELLAIKEKYRSERRTRVMARGVKDFAAEDIIPQEDTLVVTTKSGYIKRTSPKVYRSQHRGGKGVMGAAHKKDDSVDHLFITDTHANIMFFTTAGRVFQLKAYEIPEFSRTAKGQALVNFLNLTSEERVSAIIALPADNAPKYFFFVTRKGIVKKTEKTAFDTVRRSGLIALRLKPGDELCWVQGSSGNSEVVLVSSKGQAIRFHEKDVRPMGRVAAGIRGMRLKGDDYIVGINMIAEGESNNLLLNVSANGIGKFSPLKEYRKQNRGGSGIRTMRITEKTGPLVLARAMAQESRNKLDLILTSQEGQVIRTPLNKLSVLGRNTQGVKIIKLDGGDKVASGDIIGE
ncbi:MAG: DNA gyrase subunit A [Candidatus Moranbacteria bacterium]|nr:DNA gyrase subunit A [Candidatus Moranbacteria bacterium]